jgi:hypothetical protein
MITYDLSVPYIFQGNLTSIKEIDATKFQKITGHCSGYRLKKNANNHDLMLKGQFKVYEDCAVVSKEGQRNLYQDWKGGIQVPGERVYLDIKLK